MRDTSRRLWRPWSADPDERRSAEIVAMAVFVLWIGGVVIAGWKAVGDPPAMLAGAAAMLLWLLGLLYVFVLGLPPLAVHIYRLWRVDPLNGNPADESAGPVAEWQAGYDVSVARVERLKAKGALPPDYGLAPRHTGELADLVDRMDAGRPAMHIVAKILGLMLIVALIVDGQPLLATLYAVPPLAWVAVDLLGRNPARGNGA